MNFSYDICVMILLRILSKIITETSYPKLTIKPHKLHYQCKLSGSDVGSAKGPWSHTETLYPKATIKPHKLHYKNNLLGWGVRSAEQLC